MRPRLRSGTTMADSRPHPRATRQCLAARREKLAPRAVALFERDVAEHEHDADDGAGLVADGRTAVVDRDLVAPSASKDRVVREPDDRPLAQDLGDRALDRRARLLREDAEDLVERLTARIALGPPAHPLGDAV